MIQFRILPPSADALKFVGWRSHINTPTAASKIFDQAQRDNILLSVVLPSDAELEKFERMR